MRLLVNHQLIAIAIQPNSISWPNLLQKMPRYCPNFTTLSSFFDVKKQRPTTNLEKCYQCSVSIVITLDLKVCFSLVRIKINILIAPCSTNKITEISAPWWLLIKLKKFRTFSKYLEGELMFRNGFVTCRSCRMIPIFWYYNLRHSSSCSYVRFVYAISTCFW